MKEDWIITMHDSDRDETTMVRFYGDRDDCRSKIDLMMFSCELIDSFNHEGRIEIIEHDCENKTDFYGCVMFANRHVDFTANRLRNIFLISD